MTDQPQLTHVQQGRLSSFHDALTAFLKLHLPGVDVDQHYGEFDIDELKSFGVTAPAVRVSIAGPSHTLALASGGREALLVCAAFVITKATKVPAQRSASDLSEFISARIHRQTFGLTFAEPPTDVQIENHYSAALRKNLGAANMALFSVSWVQTVRFGLPTAPLPDSVTPDMLAAWGG
jgi:hypothetical protein